MINIDETLKNLNSRGFDTSFFENGEAAADYLTSSLKNETIGFGGSKTLEALGLYERLCENNSVFWHWGPNSEGAREKAIGAEVYITSANAIAQTGEIINIDGSGNRVSSTLFGKKKVYIMSTE